MSTTRVLSSTPAVLPRYVSMQVNARIIRRRVHEVLPVYFADSVGYLPVPVYVSVNGVQVAAKVIYPLDQTDINVSDIGKADFETKVTVVWTPDGIQVTSLLIPVDDSMVELTVTAV